MIGSNASGQCNTGAWTNIIQVAISSSNQADDVGFSIGLKADGTFVTAGSNTY